jgi:hypothetical protein
MKVKMMGDESPVDDPLNDSRMMKMMKDDAHEQNDDS